ncbi:MAG: hypothetical protein ACYTHJ_00295 [Planctomycetota bacterium]
MFARFRMLHGATALGLVMFVWGCEGPGTPIEIQNAHMDAQKENYQSTYTQMEDNAMLHNMSLADIHFVAHSAELSGTGMSQLDRMVPYLKTYGGKVRYESHDPDATLVAQRMEHVREYLTLVECDMTRVSVERGLSGGRTINGNDAIDIEMQGTRAPDNMSQGGATGNQRATTNR